MVSSFFLTFLLWGFVSFYCIDGATVAQCTAINFNLTVSLNKDRIFAYGGDVSVKSTDSFHSSITLSNIRTWSLNSSLYYQNDVLYFNDIQSSWILCPFTNSTECNLTVLDGASQFRLPLMLNGAQEYKDIMGYLVIDQGTIVTNDGFSFDPISKSCMLLTECCTHPYVFQYNYCCTNFTYITVPDMDPKPCLEFKGTTMLVDANVNIISLLTTTYGITSSGLNVSLTTNLLQPPFVTTNIFPNYVNYDCTSSISSSCNFMLKRGIAINSLYNMFMRGNTAEEGYGEIFLSNKIIKRNGIYLKDDYTLFTPNDSCSTVTSPFIDGLRTLNTLCCTKFQGSTEEVNNNGKFVQSKRNLRRPKPTPYNAIIN